MKHILIVDDDIDIDIGNLLEEALLIEGYRVSRAYSGTECILAIHADRPDLVLLDLMLPGLTGEEVLPKLNGIPVIILSAKTSTYDKVNLLLNGAADYITKPFEIRELTARIAVQLRKSSYAQESTLRFCDLSLDKLSRSVCISDRVVRLTPTEFAILKLLMLHPNQVLTKSSLLDRLSEETPDCTETSLKVHVSNLRKKLGNDYIESVYGIGFKLRQI